MRDFVFTSPTKIYFGKGVENNVGQVLIEAGYKTCLLVYGSGSIVKSGLYDRIKEKLDKVNLKVFEISGVVANPLIGKVREGVKVCKENNVDVILAIGGGSVIDTAKAISVGAKVDFDPYLFNLGEKTPKEKIDVVTILTISAAGSELSNSCVISDTTRNLKRGFNSDLIRPVISFLNPELTYSVSKYQTACGVVDILMHTLERFIVLDDAELTSNIAVGLMKTVISNGLICYNDPTNYEARSNIMLASSLSHNGLTSLGIKFFFTVHKLEHELSGFYPSVAHGAGLAILWHAWARYVVDKHPQKFAKFGYDVLGFIPTNNVLEDALHSIDFLESYFKQLGMPTRLSELEINNIDIVSMSLSVTLNKTKKVLGIVDLDYDDVVNIYKLAL